MVAKLSDRAIRDLKPIGKDRWIGAGVRGLYLRVRHPGGSKVFVLRRQRRGRNLVETIGEWSEGFTLADAQRIAHERRGEIKPSGKDTLGALADRYYKNKIEPRYARPEGVKRYFYADLED